MSEYAIDKQQEANEALDFKYQESQIKEFYPFESRNDYINALIRYTHPMHNTAMSIRNIRMKKKEQKYYDSEGFPELKLQDVIDVASLRG